MEIKKSSGFLSSKVLVPIILCLFIFLCMGCSGVFFPLPYSSLAPFEGKVIDAETKEPISGAVVLAVYYRTTYSVAGSNSYVVDGQETLTDENGEFKIPRKRRWFVLCRGYPEGSLVIFKPGYGRKGTAPPPKQYIVYELPKLKTIEERKKNVIYADIYDEIPYKWRKLYIKKINDECISLGVPPNTIPEEDGEK